MRRLAVLSVAIAALAMQNVALASGDADAGKTKAAACGACHGADGNATPGFPKLAGQHSDYIAKQLADFKSGARESVMMAGQAAALSEEDMADLGAYYAAQTVKVGVADEATVALGEQIYRGGITETGVSACIGCHMPNGAGTPGAGFPQLASQHADYTMAQLKAFRDGTRANDTASMMQTIAKRMTDEEIAAVSNYIQGLN